MLKGGQYYDREQKHQYPEEGSRTQEGESYRRSSRRVPFLLRPSLQPLRRPAGHQRQRLQHHEDGHQGRGRPLPVGDGSPRHQEGGSQDRRPQRLSRRLRELQQEER